MARVSRLIAWHLGALGDVVLATPALRFLRRVAPRARLEVLAAPPRGDLLVAGGVAHAAHDGTRADLAALFVEGGRPPAWLADRLRGALVALFFRDADALATNLAAPAFGAARVIAVEPRPPGGDVHAADATLDRLARAAHVPPPPLWARIRRPRLRVSAAARASAHARRTALGIAPDAALLAIHPGSGGAAKCWPPDRFAEVARRAARTLDLQPIVIDGPVEQDTPRGGAAARALAEFPRVAELTLPELAALLSTARVFLGNDSGPAHTAAAVGTPTVALFGPASFPAVFAPRGRTPATPISPIVASDLSAISGDAVLAALAAARETRP